MKIRLVRNKSISLRFEIAVAPVHLLQERQFSKFVWSIIFSNGNGLYNTHRKTWYSKIPKKVYPSLMNWAMNANKSISNPLKTQRDWKWSVKTLLFNNGTKSENSTENWDFTNSSRKALVAKHYFFSHFLILSYTVQTKRLAQLRKSSQIGQVRNTWSSSPMKGSRNGSSRRWSSDS